MSNFQNYTYCTIAVGEFYLNSAIQFAKDLNKHSKNHNFLIVTDGEFDPINNTTFVKIPEEYVSFVGESFNYMLKFLPLYILNKSNFEYLIYIDSDWRIRDNYNETNLKNLFEYMNKNNLDVFFERPHSIGAGKRNLSSCFWRHKIDFYGLNDTDVYDGGHVCNEQFLVFRKNKKFDIFINKFKDLYEISTKGKIWPFAEGVEIGMSMAYSEMKYDYYGWQFYVREIFEFNSKDGTLYVRF